MELDPQHWALFQLQVLQGGKGYTSPPYIFLRSSFVVNPCQSSFRWYTSNPFNPNENIPLTIVINIIQKWFLMNS